MEENDLDMEFKRYLQILRPYLEQLTNEKVITVCKAWMQRLSDCSDNEKILRNKYVFSLCYQLAKGVLEEPFLKYPPKNSLLPIPESVNSDDSSTEIECVVVDPDEPPTEVLFDNKLPPVSDTESLSQGNDTKTDSQFDDDMKSSCGKCSSTRQRTVLCYACPKILKKYTGYNQPGEMYEYRAKNLIKKLRDIRTENLMLHNELLTLKEELKIKHNDSNADNYVMKVDNATSAFIQSNESSATLNSLKFKLHEVQESRNSLIDKIASLQEQLDNYNEMKNHELEDVEAKYKLEIIHIKTTTRDEIKYLYEKKLEDMKMNYEVKIKEIENKSLNDMQDLKISKDDVIDEKNRTITIKDSEIVRLNSQIDGLKSHLHSVLEKFIDKPVDNLCGDSSRVREQQLSMRLNKIEKTKIRNNRAYEVKLAQLQREKHMAECSLQLQMVRQRAQVINEVTDENQADLTAALDKLEAKYKDIVANVQATAIQRRVQDQLTLESILQAACGIPHDSAIPKSANQFSKTMRNQNQCYDSEISPLLHCNKDAGNKSFGEESMGGYCLSGERLGELFERVYIPQRDNSGATK